jgi:hypothetical protein
MDIIVTADKGPDCMLVVWDAKEGTPRKTIFEFVFYSTFLMLIVHIHMEQKV